MPSRSNGTSRLLERLNKQVVPKIPSTTISFDRYLLSGRAIIVQADEYRRLKDEESLYILLMRFASLVVETLPKHPSFVKKHPTYIEYRKRIINEYMPELERLKVSLSTKGIVHQAFVKPQTTVLPSIGISDAPQVNWKEAGAPNRDPLPPRASDPMPVVVPAVLSSASTFKSLPPPQFEHKTSTRIASNRTIEKHSLFGSTNTESSGLGSVSSKTENSSLYPSAVLFPAVQALTESLIDRPQTVDLPMEIPLGPQEIEVLNVNSVPSNATETCSCPPPPLPASVVTASAVAPPPEIVSESKAGRLRNVHISVDMMESFLRIAKSNTMKEIETCAILAGQLRADLGVLEVNTLLVPRQKGTRDQVEMVDEELLLEEVLSKGLMVLGWIHTHPIFQCFLSSIDVHTTLPYQLLLDEAVAIVMAPTDRKRKCGVFRLTTPGGMDLIKDCQKRGFHEHPQTKTKQDIYEVASHVFLNPKLPVSVTDMR